MCKEMRAKLQETGSGWGQGWSVAPEPISKIVGLDYSVTVKIIGPYLRMGIRFYLMGAMLCRSCQKPLYGIDILWVY